MAPEQPSRRDISQKPAVAAVFTVDLSCRQLQSLLYTTQVQNSNMFPRRATRGTVNLTHATQGTITLQLFMSLKTVKVQPTPRRHVHPFPCLDRLKMVNSFLCGDH